MHKIDYEELDKIEAQITQLEKIIQSESFLLPEVRADLAKKLVPLREQQKKIIMGE